ncbi:hypothetical protein [Anaeromonas gelatinilytica]|uniref:hypothetical protein n=1 Tax=Anaeromonas gelatinilytica TaxID=2683194 RepID=UPI001A9C8597|nr:hypothetical protein [Anaeromonas gelatinilytica]
MFKKYFPSEEWEKDFNNLTSEVKAISEYTGLNFYEVYSLPYSLYLLYKKDSWIYGLKQTEKGQEFLKTLWRLKQTKADTRAIRAFQGRRE